MQEFAARAWFSICLLLGKTLRASKYTRVSIGSDVRKRRRSYAPPLISAGNVLMKTLDTGVRILPQREWESNERSMYSALYGLSVDVESGVLVLPALSGVTLAMLLEDPRRDESVRNRAIVLATTALLELHTRGFTHGDAMAENVMIDLEHGVARWFDFETVHDASRSMAWRRADDVRALMATCVLRTSPAVVQIITEAYADEDITNLAAKSLMIESGRPLPFHLGQAPLSFEQFARLKSAGVGAAGEAEAKLPADDTKKPEDNVLGL